MSDGLRNPWQTATHAAPPCGRSTAGLRALVRAALITSLLAPVAALADGQASLTEIEARVERDFPRVPSLVPQQAETLMREAGKVLVLDVREADEYAVSHVPGAVRVDPGLSAAQFRSRFGAGLKDRTVIVYCSVGVRSSKLAERIEDVTRAAGAAGVYNLKGGIFAWHNFGLGLRRGPQLTEFVHPYSRSWARYLDFPNYARYGARD